MAKGRPIINNYTVEKIESNIELDYSKLAQAVLDAEQMRQQAEERLAEEKRQDILKQRVEALGEKDFSYIKNWFVRNLRTALNKLAVFIRLLFVPKEIAKNISAVDSLFRAATSGLFFIIRIVLYVITAVLLYLLVTELNLVYFLYGIAAFVSAQIFRIAQIEVDYMKDREYLMAIFASIIAIVSLAVTIISEVTDSEFAIFYQGYIHALLFPVDHVLLVEQYSQEYL